MLTWMRLWPLLLLPFVPLFLVGCLPTIPLMEVSLEGGIVRQWFVNHFLLPVLPHDWAVTLVAWFHQAGYWQELLLHFIVSVDLTLVLLPLMYGVGNLVIKLSAWGATTDHAMKVKQVRN